MSKNNPKLVFFFPTLGVTSEGETLEEAEKKARETAGEPQKTTEELKKADINGDGKIDEKDFTKAAETLNEAKKSKNKEN